MTLIDSNTQKRIILRKFTYHNAERIGIYFEPLRSLNKKAKSLGAIFSKTFSCWHLPCNPYNYRAIKEIFGDCDILVEKIERVGSQHILPKATEVLLTSQAVTKVQGFRSSKTGRQRREEPLLTVNNEEELRKYTENLVLKGYSPSTQKTYKNEFSIFLQQLKNVPVQELTPEKLSSYLFYCFQYLKLSENTIHSRLNAIKFYYEQVLKRERFLWEIPRPKKHLILPKVISEEKIIAGLTKMNNLKHKALLTTAYSAGLRVSEVINLKVTDINSDRMQIFIARAKGKKDRLVTLSSFALKVLREYYKIYKPVYWLFEGQEKERCYSTRSAQDIFKTAYQQLGLPPRLSFHSLRHSFATHLLENGTDIKYIQEILGHNDINTTLRYTHVSKRAIEAIESPLDKIARKMGL